MEKIIVIDGKKYKKIAEHAEGRCNGCVLYSTDIWVNCDPVICGREGIILEKIEGEDYE